MAKRNVEIKIINFGIYDKFNHEDEDLPALVDFADKIPARLDIEFGMTVDIRKARGEIIHWRIDHPPFPDSSGNTAPSFQGQFHVNSPEYKFFLGDTVWEPVDEKLGLWTLSVIWQGKTLASKKLWLVSNQDYLKSTYDIR